LVESYDIEAAGVTALDNQPVPGVSCADFLTDVTHMVAAQSA
jgi:hypothetical protein